MLLLVAAECAGHTYLFTRSSSLSFFSSSFFSSSSSLLLLPIPKTLLAASVLLLWTLNHRVFFHRRMFHWTEDEYTRLTTFTSLLSVFSCSGSTFFQLTRYLCSCTSLLQYRMCSLLWTESRQIQKFKDKPKIDRQKDTRKRWWPGREQYCSCGETSEITPKMELGMWRWQLMNTESDVPGSRE